jgi:hypothetical protein
MKVRITAEIIRDGERKPVRSLVTEYSNLSPNRAISLAKTKTSPSRADYYRDWDARKRA